MIETKHMALLRGELEALRERMLDHHAQLSEVEALQRMTRRMIEDDEGEFQANLRFVEMMLDGIGRTVEAQQQLNAMAARHGLSG